MAALTEGPHIAEFLLSEAPGWRSRDTIATVTVAANTTLKSGTVLEIAAGKHITLATSGNAAAVLYSELKNDTAAPVDMKGVVVNRDAEIRTASLLWPTGWVAANWAASLTALKVLGLIARP
jgi:hypothetical protein